MKDVIKVARDPHNPKDGGSDYVSGDWGFISDGSTWF